MLKNRSHMLSDYLEIVLDPHVKKIWLKKARRIIYSGRIYISYFKNRITFTFENCIGI